MEGWIKLYRKLTEHWLWEEKPFDKRSAWIDMLMMANHEEKKICLGNELINVERGSFITSELKLMERWGWSKCKVRNFLKMLEEDGMILRKSDKKKTTITIVNYSIYQDSETTERPHEDHKETTERPQKDTNKNDKNDNNDKNDKNIYSQIPYDEIANLYNSTCISFPKIKQVTDKRKRALKNTWKKINKDISILETAFKKAEESDFLSGRNEKWTGCNFDWLINYNNLIKVLEGTYDNKDSNVIDYKKAVQSKYHW